MANCGPTQITPALLDQQTYDVTNFPQLSWTPPLDVTSHRLNVYLVRYSDSTVVKALASVPMSAGTVRCEQKKNKRKNKKKEEQKKKKEQKKEKKKERKKKTRKRFNKKGETLSKGYPRDDSV